jgi:predicted HicB family RNase H-like nuclease
MVQTAIRISEESKTDLQDMAARSGISMSKFVEMLIRHEKARPRITPPQEKKQQ